MFKNFTVAVGQQFKAMTVGLSSPLYKVEIDPDLLWKTYLESFPEGSNPLYKTRAEHDCTCCRHFIRTVGAVVTLHDGEIATIWDNAPQNLDPAFQVVSKEMSELVRTGAIENIFLHAEKTAGTAKSLQLLEDKSVKTWEHFFVNLPAVVVKGDQIGPRLANARATHDVMLRSLQSIPVEAIEREDSSDHCPKAGSGT